jgi:hypothetical protein
MKVKSMFDRLSHPIFLTLTVPNNASIRTHDFTIFRERVRELLAQYSPKHNGKKELEPGFFLGGVYSLETTYNRAEKTLHFHAHVLLDGSSSLPPPAQKLDVDNSKSYAFNAIKYRLEFDWLRLSS